MRSGRVLGVVETGREGFEFQVWFDDSQGGAEASSVVPSALPKRLDGRHVEYPPERRHGKPPANHVSAI